MHPCRAGVDVPTVEVRADGLSVDSSVYVGGRAAPTLINAYRNFIEVRSVSCTCMQLNAEAATGSIRAERELCKCC